MYGSFGFQHQRDIATITVNRWSHGFVYDSAEYRGEPANLTARAHVGNIMIANAGCCRACLHRRGYRYGLASGQRN